MAWKLRSPGVGVGVVPFSSSFMRAYVTASTSRASSSRPAGELLVGAKASRIGAAAARPVQRGWRAVGWFGLLLAVIGFADMGLHLFRPAFGSAEWQFATMAAMMASLPLPTIGLAALVGALLVNQARVPGMITAAALLVLGLAIAAGYVLFLLQLPLALSAAAGPQGTAIYRTIARTTIMGVGFGSAYLIAAIMLFRHLPRRSVS